MGNIRGALSKVVNSAFTALWTLIFRLMALGLWKIDSGLRVEGRVILRSMRGRLDAGRNLRIGSLVNIAVTEGGAVQIGDDVSINQGVYLVARESVKIGNGVRIGEYSSIRDNSHRFDKIDVPVHRQGFSTSGIDIGDDVWLGRCVTVMPGVKIGRGAVIGAHSVVVRNVPDYEVHAGIPAKKIKSRGAVNAN